MKHYKILVYIFLAIATILPFSLHSQDTIYLNGTNRVDFKLNRTISTYFVNCTQSYNPASTTIRSLASVGRFLLKSDGSGYIIPISGYRGEWKIYTPSCGLVQRTVLFMSKPIAPPPTPVFNYSWKGLIGNTSTIDFGKDKIKALRSPTSVSELNGFIYVTTGFVEGNSSIFKTPINNPTIRMEVPPKTNSDKVLEGVCGVSDGTRFYLVGFDPYGRTINGGTGYSSKIDCAVVAYDINDKEVIFQYGQSISCTLQDNPYKSAIAVIRNDTSQLPIKLEVDNQFLYVYTRTLIKKYDKVSGLYISMTSYTPNNIISSFTRNGVNLVMTSTNVTYNGKVLCTAQTSPKVDYYTYTPKDYNTFKTKGYVYIGSDGSMYVCDAGNSRILKYSSTGVYINQIAYIPMNYNCSVDRNNPTKVFAGFLEYKVSYPSLSWELVNNWSYGINKAYTPNEQLLGALRHIVTVNNETFAIIDSFLQYADYSMRYPSKVKLTNTGAKTIKTFDPFANVWLDQQGNEYIANCGNELNSYNTLYKNGVIIEKSPIITTSSASYMDDGGFVYTSDGYYIVYNNRTNAKLNHHLEWIKGGQVIYKGAKALQGVQTTYPTNDSYMVEGVSGEASSFHISNCKDITVFMYNGEGFQNAQVTKLHIYKGGQFYKIIGKTYAEAVAESGTTEAPKEFAGNAFAGNLVNVNGVYYYFFNCEHTGAIQCFILNNL
jgi:hypothetical protein